VLNHFLGRYIDLNLSFSDFGKFKFERKESKFPQSLADLADKKYEPKSSIFSP